MDSAQQPTPANDDRVVLADRQCIKELFAGALDGTVPYIIGHQNLAIKGEFTRYFASEKECLRALSEHFADGAAQHTFSIPRHGTFYGSGGDTCGFLRGYLSVGAVGPERTPCLIVNFADDLFI